MHNVLAWPAQDRLEPYVEAAKRIYKDLLRCAHAHAVSSPQTPCRQESKLLDPPPPFHHPMHVDSAACPALPLYAAPKRTPPRARLR